MFARCRGTQDIYSTRADMFEEIVSCTRSTAAAYGFAELITPVIEFSRLFERNLGEGSDVISKEIYRFIDRSGDEISLRPEFTAGVVRSYGDILKDPTGNSFVTSRRHRVFSSGPVFRYDRPQQGRYRQFHQVNCELFRPVLGGGKIGNETEERRNTDDDIELILLADRLLGTLPLQGKISLEINTLGSRETIEKYSSLLKDFFSRYKSDLSEVSVHRIERSPLRILDSKDKRDREISLNAPSISTALSDSERKNFDTVLSHLAEMGIEPQINPNLVRGLDYYTGIVFEYTTAELGSQSTVLAGGRYDNLVGSILQKPEAFAVGFAAGIERLMLLLKDNFSTMEELKICVLPIGEEDVAFCIQFAEELRTRALEVKGKSRASVLLISDTEQSVSKRMQRINSSVPKSPKEGTGKHYAIIIGKSERQSGTIKLKNLLDFTEAECQKDECFKLILK